MTLMMTLTSLFHRNCRIPANDKGRAGSPLPAERCHRRAGDSAPYHRYEISRLKPKRICLGLALAVAVLAAGCLVPSIYPFYTEKEVVFESALLGTWEKPATDADTREIWSFEKADEKEYKFTFIDGDRKNVFAAHLFKLKEHLFMDCLHVEQAGDGVPPHYLLKVVQIEPTLKTAMFDYSWLKKLLDKNPGALRHALIQNEPGSTNASRIVLTADTAELQKFILKHIDGKDTFGDLNELKRREPAK
jgi:hypothetical protein